MKFKTELHTSKWRKEKISQCMHYTATDSWMVKVNNMNPREGRAEVLTKVDLLAFTKDGKVLEMATELFTGEMAVRA